MVTFKRLLKSAVAIAIGSSTLLSCSKDETGSTGNDADRFVGTYSISVTEQVVWGSDSGTLTDTGVLTITKISDTQVRASGFFNDIGEVTNSAIYFESIKTSDSAGYMTTTFSPATLSGNVLTMTATSTGQLPYNGVRYPYRSTQQITGIKR